MENNHLFRRADSVKSENFDVIDSLIFETEELEESKSSLEKTIEALEEKIENLENVISDRNEDISNLYDQLNSFK